MKEVYSHKILTSFALWFENTLLQKGEAFQNVNTRLYPSVDDRVSDDYTIFASPFRQWVPDSSVSGVVVPSGVTINGTFTSRGSGVIMDFENGRIFLDADTYDDTDVVSGSYGIKDLNVYTVSNEETRMVFEGNYQLNSKYGMIAESGVSPFGYAAPAAFIMNTLSDNKPFAFGGEQDTKNKFRVIVAADNTWLLDGCTSVFRDLTESNIPLLNVSDAPLNEYGDIKSGVYNYRNLANAATRLVFLERVTVSKVSNSQELKINPNLKFGIIDFYLSEPRFPKLDL